MRTFSIILVAVVAGGSLAGCAGGSTKSASQAIGLTSGPLPQPQPFVTASRPAPTRMFPNVGTTPPRRNDVVLNISQRKALEDSLLATPGRHPDSPKPAGRKKKKPAKSMAAPAM